MKVDIIIPTYNPTNYLAEAIDSCLVQSYRDIKITVIDDCSTTDLTPFKRKYPTVNFLKTQKNGGPAVARNTGIKNTTAPLISFLDDDDIMDVHKIAWSVQEFEKSSNVGLVCGNYRILVNRVKLLSPFYKKAPIINWETLISNNLVASGSTTVKRTAIEDVGLFDERFWIGEDYSTWLKLSEKYPIKYIHRVLYLYSKIPGNNSLTERKDIQKNHLKNLQIIKDESKQRMKK